MNDREQEIINGVIKVAQTYLNPVRVVLFGSRAKGENGEQADFDIAIDCAKPEISVQRKISEEIDKIKGLYKIDVVYMSSVDEAFKDIILATGKVLYEQRA